ncbi:hypothetical protein Tco_0940951 [Tanacetum coccineum]|uniref:BZIP domain-containing protein n=1 Tax=Tanacetum coccineum TaxID=301880 RepID=A0ABQ5DS26_9ASTR
MALRPLPFQKTHEGNSLAPCGVVRRAAANTPEQGYFPIYPVSVHRERTRTPEKSTPPHIHWRVRRKDISGGIGVRTTTAAWTPQNVAKMCKCDRVSPRGYVKKQEVKQQRKAVAQVARRDQRIQAREKDIKNLEALLEAEADMKEAAEAKNAKLVKELESLRVQFSDLQVSNNQLSQQVSTLQA